MIKNNFFDRNDYKLTIEGYESLLNRMTELKELNAENQKEMSRSFKDATGDGAHDNHEFETLLANERMLVGEMNRLTEKIKNVEIIESPVLNANQVNINDNLILRIISDDKPSEVLEEDNYTLVGTDGDSSLNQISINSPIGKAIFTKNVGDTVSYTVGDMSFHVIIMDKVAVFKK